jgi:RimJ/RimL family protein N-acetyltransferase
MGILVASKSRRKNIARFLSNERVKLLKELKAPIFYSIVDSENLTSRKMLEEFGFRKIDEAQGFLHLDFKEKKACLYCLNID